MLFLFSIGWGAITGWWALLCLVAGAICAWLLYRNPVYLSRPYHIGLAIVRGILVSLIGLLLVSPLFKTTAYRPQKPLILVAQDNSSSISVFHPVGFQSRVFIQQLSTLQQQLGSDYEVKLFRFDKNLADGLSARFNGQQTNIAAALRRLNERYENQNIGAVVLATDGLYNTGAEPEAEVQRLKTTLFTVALGDTTQRRDARITNINYNQTAFLGNDFIIEVLTEALQCRGQILHLSVTEDGRQIHTQNLDVVTDNYHKTIQLKLNADRKGLHRFVITISPVAHEITTANNSQTFYIDVLDARQKVLLVYHSPHPDVSVIKQAIEQNKNYQVKAITLNQLSTIKPSDYSLLILHQLTAGSHVILKQMLNSRLPVWYMLGAQSSLNEFSQEQKTIQINAGQQTMQETFASPVDGFSAFTLADSTFKLLSGNLPPLLAPFGNYRVGAGAQELLKQKIGNVNTAYPLLLFNKSNNQALAVLTGEGLWRWQLAEYAAYGNHHAIEDLFTQSVQYLTANANRQRFRIYTTKNVFNESENVLLNAELYNEALELVNTPDVSLNIRNKGGKVYSYQFSRNGQSYQLNAGALPAGEYNYTGTAKLGSTSFSANGQFTVQAINVESQQSRADHQLLRRIAKQSGGAMLLPHQLSQLARLIKQNDNIKTIEYADEHYAEAIDIKWLLGLILLLLSAEWIVRKREGEV